MFGSFSSESLKKFQQLTGLTSNQDFSEGVFDFTRCVRTNGTAYGTAGKCRKGTEQEKQKEPIGDDGQIALLKSMAKADLNGPKYEEFRKSIENIGNLISKATSALDKAGKDATQEEVQIKMGGLEAEEKLAKKAFDALWKGHAESKGMKNTPVPELAEAKPLHDNYGFRSQLGKPAYEAMIRLGAEKFLGQLDLNRDLKSIAKYGVYGWYVGVEEDEG